jgi:hypothetical protein
VNSLVLRSSWGGKLNENKRDLKAFEQKLLIPESLTLYQTKTILLAWILLLKSNYSVLF